MHLRLQPEKKIVPLPFLPEIIGSSHLCKCTLATLGNSPTPHVPTLLLLSTLHFLGQLLHIISNVSLSFDLIIFLRNYFQITIMNYIVLTIFIIFFVIIHCLVAKFGIFYTQILYLYIRLSQFYGIIINNYTIFEKKHRGKKTIK